MMKKVLTLLMTTTMLSQGLVGCSSYYADQVKAPSDQELEDERTGANLKPRSRIRPGIFHMQRVQTGSRVRVKENVELKKPDLPPFEVAYIGRDLESIVLEMANIAGESVIVPAGLRGHKITLVHSGADFPTMLDMVLSKAGYHYNYVDGVWYITKYPIRNYVLEMSQSARRGGLIASTELAAESAQTVAGGSDITTEYTDGLWDQVENTVKELIDVGVVSAPGIDQTANLASASNLITEETSLAAAANGGSEGGGSSEILPPPQLDENADPDEMMFEAMTAPTGVKPVSLDAKAALANSSAPEEDATPWYKITESAGLITVRAAPEAHRQIERYLEEVQDSAMRQVVVEARIVALIRDKTTSRGIQSSLNILKDSVLAAKLGFTPSSQIDSSTVTGGFVTFNTDGKSDLTAILQSLSSLGDVYTLSNPTVLVRNNQLSRVSVTRQLGYVETEVETATGTTGDVNIGARTDRAAFKNSGTVMSVIPFIGKGGVQMRFRLSVATKSSDTRVLTSIGDSTPVENFVPNLANNVIDQDMVLDFGRVYAIGGLIETSTSIDDSYEPGLSQIPGMQEIFSRANNQKEDTEFIVLLRVSRA